MSTRAHVIITDILLIALALRIIAACLRGVVKAWMEDDDQRPVTGDNAGPNFHNHK
jgi:hypothetical protein